MRARTIITIQMLITVAVRETTVTRMELRVRMIISNQAGVNYFSTFSHINQALRNFGLNYSKVLITLRQSYPEKWCQDSTKVEELSLTDRYLPRQKGSLLIEFSRSVGAVVSLVRMLGRLRWRDQTSTSSWLWIWLKLYGKNVNYDKFVRHFF